MVRVHSTFTFRSVTSSSRREFLHTGAVAAAGLMLRRVSAPFGRADSSNEFEPTRTSLAQCRTPDWFHDAKFGM